MLPQEFSCGHTVAGVYSNVTLPSAPLPKSHARTTPHTKRKSTAQHSYYPCLVCFYACASTARLVTCPMLNPVWFPSFLCFAPRPPPPVENSKTFEELLVEDRIMKDRAELALPLNSLNQMWVYDKQTCIATRPKK